MIYLAWLAKWTYVYGACRRWKGPKDRDGYGMAWLNGRSIHAHRAAFHLATGFDVDSKLSVLHKPECKFRDCCEESHLYAGTQKDNVDDQIRAGTHNSQAESRRTHCPQGHPYSPENTFVAKYGERKTRRCRECGNARHRRWYANKRAAL